MRCVPSRSEGSSLETVEETATAKKRKFDFHSPGERPERSNIVPFRTELGPYELEVVPPRERCSKIGEDCRKTKCCVMSGYLCYEKDSSWASCLKKCVRGGSTNGNKSNEIEVQKPTPEDKAQISHWKPFFKPAPPGPWTCNRPRSLIPTVPAKPVDPTRLTLFCFTVMLSNNGNGKQQTDVSLVRTQLQTKTSIFGCENWTVFSDQRVWLTHGNQKEKATILTTKVVYPKIIHRPNTKLWVNSPLFVNVWRELKEQGTYKRYDWTVKVDPSTVFFPMRLRAFLKDQKTTSSGVYFENCRYVRMGFYGGLEVMDKVAAEIVAEHIADCFQTLPWEHAQHAHFRYYGEDKLLMKCMDKHGVHRVPSMFDVNYVASKGQLLVDNGCPAHLPKGDLKQMAALGKQGYNVQWFPNCAKSKAVALHAFRKPKDYFRCLKKAQADKEHLAFA